MAFDVTYKKLAEVRIFHDYFLNQGNTHYDNLSQVDKTHRLDKYDLSDLFTIEPVNLPLYQNYDCEFKIIRTGFFIAVRVNNLGTPTTPTWTPALLQNQPFSLPVYLHVKDPSLSYYSNLPAVAVDEIIYISNAAGLSGVNYPSLSQNIKSYQANTEYPPGSLVIHLSKVYEARYHLTSTGNTAFAAGDWQEITAKNYLHRQDMMKYCNQVFKYSINDPAVDTLTVLVKDFTGSELMTLQFDNVPAHREVMLDFSDLMAGKYELEISGNNSYSDTFSIFNSISRNKPAVVIDLLHDPATNYGNHALLDITNQNQITDRQFEVYLKNRASYWRYIFKNEQNIDVGNLGNILNEFNDKKTFVVDELRPLTHYPIPVDLHLVDKVYKCPNPQGNNLRPQKGRLPNPTLNLKYYSETYL